MSRWSCPSVALQLGRLRRKSQHAFWVALVLAACLHSLVGQIAPARRQDKAAKPLTTQFVKRQPRLTKPLEMRREPLPKRRRMKRTMVTVRPEESPARASARGRPPELVLILASPGVTVSRMGYAAGAAMEPEVAAREIVGTREDENVVDMCLEMLDAESLDYGRYPALVIQDPQDKRNIRGFLRVAPVLLSGQLVGHGRLPPGAFMYDAQQEVRGLAALVRRMNELTDVRVSFLNQLGLGSQEVFDLPWVYLMVFCTSPPYTPLEERNLGRYLLAGGFVLSSAGRWTLDARHRVHVPRVEMLVSRALATQGYREGRQWTFESLPGEHEALHCFFDFDAGAPQWRLFPSVYCSIVNLDGRTVCLTENQWYVDAITPYLRKGEPGTAMYYEFSPGSGAVFRFMINTIVFALTQEGSIAQRVMDGFNY